MMEDELDQELFLQRCNEYGPMYMMWWYFCGENNQDIEGAKFKIGQPVYVKLSDEKIQAMKTAGVASPPHIVYIKAVKNESSLMNALTGGEENNFEYAISGAYWYLLWEDELEAAPIIAN